MGRAGAICRPLSQSEYLLAAAALEESGIWLAAWQQLLSQLDQRSLLDWNEAFLDATFIVAKACGVPPVAAGSAHQRVTQRGHPCTDVTIFTTQNRINDLRKRHFYNKSLERALNVLCSYDFDQQELSLSELGIVCGLPKSTTHRLVCTLVDYDFLQYDPQSQRYSLGLRILGLGAVANNSVSLRKIVSPFLTALHIKLDKTVALAVLRGDELVYVDKRENWRNAVKSTEMGRHRPAHFGMFGPLMMAYLTEEEIDRILAKNPLVRYTKNSITNKAEFKRWLRAIRDQGYVIDKGTFDGVSGIAAPIEGPTGTVVGGIGVSLITAAENADGVNKIVRELIRTTKSVSDQLKNNTKLKNSQNT